MKRRADGRYHKVMVYKRSDGTMYHKNFYGLSEAEVFRKVQKYEAEQESGPLFKTIADDWKEDHYPGLEHNTQRGYEKSFKKAVNHFGECHAKALTHAAVKAYMGKLKAQGYAAKTASHHLSVLRMILAKAVVDGIIPSNPAEYIKVPAGLKKAKRKPPIESDVRAIENNLDKPFGFYAYLLLHSGLRKSEALALQRQDFNFIKKEIPVTKAWYAKNNRPYIKHYPKTEEGERIIPLLDCVERAFHICIGPGEPTDYIFGLLTEKEFRVRWDNYRAAAGISCTSHQIRHEFCTFLYDAGINEFDAMKIMGHADITTMRNIYTHIREGRMGHVREVLNKKLEKPKGRKIQRRAFRERPKS